MTTIQIIGVGNVGSQIAFGIICRFPGVRLILTDSNENKLKAELYELESAAMLLNPVRLESVTSLVPSDVYIIAIGLNTNGERSRKDLVENVNPCDKLFDEIHEINPRAWVFVVTNPSHDIASRGLKKLQRVIPAGKMLDATRTSLSVPRGTHESPETKDVYKTILNGKGHTSFGPAAEVLRLLQELALFDQRGGE